MKTKKFPTSEAKHDIVESRKMLDFVNFQANQQAFHLHFRRS